MVFSANKKKALSIIPHITGALSVFGSCSILYDVWKDRSSKLRRPYYRILLGMSIFDVMASTSIGLSTWPIPYGTEGVYAAMGTTATCSAQGFFNQLMLISPFYNLMLAGYYLLLGREKPMSEEEIGMRYEKYMHAFAILPGTSVALSGLPLTLYNSANLWCWISAYPSSCENGEGIHGPTFPCERGHNAWLYRWLFFYAPLWIIIITITAIMIMLTRAVRIDEKRIIELQKKNRLRRPSVQLEDDIRREQNLPPVVQREESVRLERSRQMFHQAIFYVGVFYLTWLFATLNRMTQLINGQSYFSLMVLHSILTPAQGFLNFIVYRHGPCVA